jgi:hypothetical protein
MSRSVMLLVGGLAILGAASARAQEPILGQLYGSGVHAYFAQDYVKAHQYLTAAIEGKASDPACYYFRGLAELRLGRPQDAELDFQHGAKLESGELNRPYNVSKALERVQGPDRAAIEHYRIEARMLAMNRARQQPQRSGQEAAGDQEGRVPHQPIESPAEPAKPAIENPFDAGGTAPKPPAPETAKPEAALEKPAPETAKPEAAPEKPVPEPAEKPEAKPESEGPLATPAKPPAEPAKPAADDPFVTPPAKPAVEPAKPAPEAAKPAGEAPAAAPVKPPVDPEKKGGLLGGLGHALGTMVGGDAAKGVAPGKPETPAVPGPAPVKPEPAATDPFAPAVPGNPPAAAPGADPFGTAPAAKPPADKPAADKPAADKPAADKPAADKPAAKAPAAADPFAEEPAAAAKPEVKPEAEPAAKPAPAASPDPFAP